MVMKDVAPSSNSWDHLYIFSLDIYFLEKKRKVSECRTFAIGSWSQMTNVLNIYNIKLYKYISLSAPYWLKGPEALDWPGDEYYFRAGDEHEGPAWD